MGVDEAGVEVGRTSGTMRLPEVPSMRQASPGSVTPAARVDAAKSAPPTTTGVPGASPVARAAAAVIAPATARAGRKAGSLATSTPAATAPSADQARARASYSGVQSAADEGSVTRAPVRCITG